MIGVATIHQGDSVEKIEAPTWDVVGIPAGVQELVTLVAEGGEPVSPGTEGYKVVPDYHRFFDFAAAG